MGTEGASDKLAKDAPQYIFVRSAPSEPGQDPGVSNDVESFTFFNDLGRFAWDKWQRRSELHFSLGPTHAGSYLHRKSNAYNALVYGRKKWFLFPPNTFFGPGSQLSMVEWLKQGWMKRDKIYI